MTPGSDDPVKAAFQAGAEQAALKAQVAQHEIRLDRINGSMDRNAVAIEKLGDRFEEFVARSSERDAVLAKEREMIAVTAAQAEKKQISVQQWRLGILTVSVMLAGVIVAVVTLVASLPK